MDKLIDINAYPVKDTLKILLQDKSTKKNIIWATDIYSEYGVKPQTLPIIITNKTAN